MRGRVVVLLGAVCGVTVLTLGPVALGAGAAMPDRRQSSVSERAPEKVETSGSVLPVTLNELACMKDKKHDWNFFNGLPVTLRKDNYVDILGFCAVVWTPDPVELANLEQFPAVGATGGRFGEGPLLIVVTKVNGDYPKGEVPGVASRFTVGAALAGDMKGKRTPETPNLYSDGLNALFELDEGVPEGSGIEVFAEDRRLFTEDGVPVPPIDAAARFFLEEDFIIAVIPLSLFSDLEGIRVATTSGVQREGGDVAKNDSDVAPGGKDGPFPIFEYRCILNIKKLVALHKQGACKKVFLRDTETLETLL
jgi:hypothetical protein